MREDGRIVGGEGWQEKVHNREEWKKLLRTAWNRRILHVPMEWMNYYWTQSLSKWYNNDILLPCRRLTLNIQQNTKALISTRNTPLQTMSVINTLCAKFISINTSLWLVDSLSRRGLTALLPSVVKNEKCQLTRVKRCRSKPPSFQPVRLSSLPRLGREESLWLGKPCTGEMLVADSRNRAVGGRFVGGLISWWWGEISVGAFGKPIGLWEVG